MKHAILITAYKDIESLVDLIEILGNGFNFYIHIDRKKKLNVDSLRRFENVEVCNTFKVNWGGLNHFLAILELSKQALKNKENTFFHLITAEDFPIKSSKYILDVDISKSYISYFPFPKLTWDENGGTDRYSYYHFYDVFDAKTKVGGRSIHLIILLQKLFKFKRAELPVPQMFGGSTYWSVNKKALSYLIDNIDDKLLNRLKFTFCAEEYIFHSILLNSPLRDEICNTNLRYIDWHSKRMGDPAFLDESDFDILVDSNALFARKIKKSPNSKLISLLKDHIKM
ncbi:MAG: beta-1,6-N-acetylglucosaminyltransferase [Pedobacter sp.]|nr:beta-1,6-N-acetylglucosaminyltransferase [Pedobacter sp.]